MKILPSAYAPPDVETLRSLPTLGQDSEPNSRLVKRFLWPNASLELGLAYKYLGVRCGQVSELSAPCVASEAVELEAEIQRAEGTILGLESDWDGDGGGTYSKATFSRAASLLRLYQAQLRRSSGLSIPLLSIGPGPDGSIDLFWANDCGKLLINIPADCGELATDAGTDSMGQKAKGSFDPARFNQGIAGWLTTLLGR